MDEVGDDLSGVAFVEFNSAIRVIEQVFAKFPMTQKMALLEELKTFALPQSLMKTKFQQKREISLRNIAKKSRENSILVSKNMKIPAKTVEGGNAPKLDSKNTETFFETEVNLNIIIYIYIYNNVVLFLFCKFVVSFYTD